MFETNTCPFKDKCLGHPFSCSSCIHSGKKNYYSPRYTFTISGITNLPRFDKNHYTFDCVTPVKITLPKPRGKK